MWQSGQRRFAVITRRVVIVEDDPMMRGMLATQLEDAGFEVGTAATGTDARRLCAILDPDALVMDIDLGAGMNGLDVADALLSEYPHLTVLFLTHLPDTRFAGRDAQSLPRGVGYLRKESLLQPGVLVEALDAVLRGNVTRQHRQDLDPSRPLLNLSRTQLEVLNLLAKGHTNPEIADMRGTTLRAVQALVVRTFQATGIGEHLEGPARVEAVRQFLSDSGLTIPTQTGD